MCHCFPDFIVTGACHATSGKSKIEYNILSNSKLKDIVDGNDMWREVGDMKAKQVLHFIVVITMLLVFLANFSDLNGQEYSVAVSGQGQMGICAENSIFSEVVHHQESLGTKAQSLFSGRSLKHVSKHVLSLKNLRMILLVCLQTCLFAFVQFRIFWVSERLQLAAKKPFFNSFIKKTDKKYNLFL